MTNATALKRILIFDDDSDFRKLLLLRLKKMFEGVQLEEYDPVANGVPEEDFNWAGYDVLLLDYYLCIHGVTGLDILHKNRKNPNFPATIMLTGAGNEEIAVHALKSGVSDYIRKENLDKEELRKSILTAFEEQKEKRKKINDATLHGQAFNKARFYEQLDNPDRDTNKRILLIMQLDAHERIAKLAGIIVRDNVVRHLAKYSFEVFQGGKCNPSITRYNESSIALLIDDPESQDTLEFNLKGLCQHLQKRPYKFSGKKYRFTVSIGVVSVSETHDTAATMLDMASRAAEAATATQGENSYKFYNQLEPVEEKDETGESGGVAAPEVKQEAVPEKKTAAAPLIEPAPGPAPKPQATAEPKPESAPLSDAKKVTPAKQAPTSATAPAPVPEAQKTPAPAKPEADPQVEKKSEAKAPPPTPKKQAPVPESDESILDGAALNMAALAVKRSFEEKRVIQIFQPVISFLADEGADESEIYSISLELVDADGTHVSADEVLSRVADVPAFFKYIDRWMLREAIGRAVNSNQSQFLFIMKISDASLADTTLFNWLRQLLSGLEKSHPGRSITFEISADSFASHQKPAQALMAYLRKSHGFRFMLAHVDNLESLKTLTEKTSFDFLKVSPAFARQLSEETNIDAEAGGSILSNLKNRNTRIVVKDVEDATVLTEVISIGADFAMGEFIGEATTQLDDTTNVESFNIS
jgi:EAL domain-containing protein (putative c-di-GMP-specific phosphodiesterase class I)/FixJ family two-component response regulator